MIESPEKKLEDSSEKNLLNTSEKKLRKYRIRIAAALAIELISTKEIEKLHGCLNYVAEVETFGRPFLAHLTTAISEAGDEKMITLSKLTRLGLKIWDLLLQRKKGITFDFLLGRLQQHSSDIFVDASSLWGIGGCIGEYFFYIPWEKLVRVEE